MPFTLTMPKLSPTMEEGAVAKWHKKVGDFVKAGELLLEVATDKATVEYNAVDEGYLRKILTPQGAHAAVNQPIAIFSLKQNEPIDQYVPEPVVSSSTKQPDKPAEKKEIEAPKPAAARMEQPAFTPEPPLTNYTFAFPGDSLQKRIAASPLAKKLAKEKGLDLSSIKGSGPHGRVVADDLNLAQPAKAVSFNRHQAPTIAPGTFEEIPLSPMRKTIATRLQQSKSFIPHFYVRQEINVQELSDLREQLKNGGIQVTFNDFIIRAAALSLRDHPEINSGFNSVNSSIIRFQTIDIAIAVSIESGLITPIIRHADYKNLGELSVEIRELAKRAKEGKLQPEEYKGGSFTVSNLGMFGISEFAAIINPPQAAILAVGGMEECVRLKNEKAVLGKKMTLTLSADHRVLDGSEAAKFLKTIQKYLENPALLII